MTTAPPLTMQEMDEHGNAWKVRVHAANGHMATVFGPKFKAAPECEGGRWYTDPETAHLIAAAPALRDSAIDAFDALTGYIDMLESENPGTSLYYGRSVLKKLASAIADSRGAQDTPPEAPAKPPSPTSPAVTGKAVEGDSK